MRFPAAPLLPLLMPLLLLLGASALTGALDCSVDDLCTSGGEAFCPGQAFYPPDCMPNACTCAAGGGLKCTKMACVAQCSTDADCAAVIRSATAQPSLFPLCGCEARSTVPDIADRFEECLGEDRGAGVGCLRARCGDSCEGKRAVCLPGGRCGLKEVPEMPGFCPADVRSCEDGTFVSRDPELGCAFRTCAAVVPPPPAPVPMPVPAPVPVPSPPLEFGDIASGGDADGSGDGERQAASAGAAGKAHPSAAVLAASALLALL